MPVNFLTEEQNQDYARYREKLTEEQLDKYFYLDDKDKGIFDTCRRDDKVALSGCFFNVL